MWDNQPFSPQAPEVSLAVTSASGRVSLSRNDRTPVPDNGTVLITNQGPADVHVVLGNSAVVALTTDRRVPAGSQLVIGCNDPAFTYIAAITDAGTATIKAQYGGGIASAGGGGGGSSASTAYTFNTATTPTVTNGAYSAGDIMGGLLSFDICPASGVGVIVQNAVFAFKAAVTPSLQLVLFNANPSATTTTDNAAYSLNVADTGKVIAALPINSIGGYLVDHGTPNTIQLNNIALVAKPASGTTIYGLLIDLTGVTLTSTSDLIINISGTGAQ